MDIGGKIAKLRSSKGWSQAQLADQIGVSEDTVKDWESGSSVPAGAKIEAIASALGVEAEYLVPGGEASQAQDERSSANPVANGYGSYRMARDEMRMERDEMRYASSKGSAFYAIYWVIVVLVYLAASYFTHGWSWSWIIFLVAGAVFYPIMNSQKK